MLGEWQRIWPQLAYGVGLAGLAGILGVVTLRLRAVQGELRRERRGREELEAYLRLDLRMTRNIDMRALSRRVCEVVARRSVFSRVAMLARDAEGNLYPAASVGMETETTASIEEWARRTGHEEEAWMEGVLVGTFSRTLVLNKASGRVLVTPLRLADDRVAGALVVCAESLLQVPRQLADEAAVGLEALAMKVARAVEGGEPMARSGRVEKLAGKLALSRSLPLKVIGTNGYGSHAAGETQAHLGQA